MSEKSNSIFEIMILQEQLVKIFWTVIVGFQSDQSDQNLMHPRQVKLIKTFKIQGQSIHIPYNPNIERKVTVNRHPSWTSIYEALNIS